MDKLIILFNYYQYLFIVKSKQRYYNNNNTITHNDATILPRIVSNLTDLLDPCLFLGGTNFAWPRKPVRRTRFKVIEKDSILWMKEEEKKKIVFRGPCNFIASKKPPHSFVDSSDVTWGRYPGTGTQRRRLNEGGWASTTLLFNPRIEKSCIRPMGELRAAVRRPIANRWWLRKARGRRGPRS